MGWFSKKSAPTLQQEVAAIMRIMANLAEVMIAEERQDHAPLVLRLDSEPARFRHLLFCLETTYYFAVSTMTDAARKQAIADESCSQTLKYAVNYRGEGQIFSGVVDLTQMSAQASAHLHHFSTAWVAYMRHLENKKASGRSEATVMVAAMLRYVEAESALGTGDTERLRPLAIWVEDTLFSLESSFRKLAESGAA
jgi:hypothetical protein